ncbi:MAG: hypothetical protein ACREJX_17440 [Polyangiaceae bacterium]
MKITRRILLDVACGFGLLSLALMAWSVLDPRPMPVILAMSVGQVIGTISFGTFLIIVIGDLRLEMVREERKRREHHHDNDGEC